jgi:hypothetical protein
MDYGIQATEFDNFFEMIHRDDLSADEAERERKPKYKQKPGNRWSTLEREFGACILLPLGIEFPNYLYEILRL